MEIPLLRTPKYYSHPSIKATPSPHCHRYPVITGTPQLRAPFYYIYSFITGTSKLQEPHCYSHPWGHTPTYLLQVPKPQHHLLKSRKQRSLRTREPLKNPAPRQNHLNYLEKHLQVTDIVSVLSSRKRNL